MTIFSFACHGVQCMVSFPHPDYRFVLPVTVLDHAGAERLTLFDDCAAQLLGVTANDMMVLKEDPENGGKVWAAAVLQARFRTYLFRIRVKVGGTALSQHFY
jgi:replication factor A1